MRLARPGSALVAGALCLACAKAPSAPPPFPYSTAEPCVFVATGSGLVLLPAGADIRPYSSDPRPAALAPNANAITSDGKVILAAVNRAGVALIEAAPGGKAFRVANRPGPEHFAARTAGGVWPRRGGFLAHLYRDPYAGEAEDRSPPSSILALDERGTASVLPLPAEPPYQVFALFPGPGGSWYAELREDRRERVVSRYLRMDAPGSGGTARAEIGREEFENSLAPRRLAEAGAVAPAAERALRALVSGPYVLRLRGPDGRDAWYGNGEVGGDAVSVSAWALADGRIVAVAEGTTAVVALPGGSTLRLDLRAPILGAAFTSVAASNAIAAFAWEAGAFPSIRYAGIVVLALP